MASETIEKDPKIGGRLQAETLFETPYYPDSFQFPYNPDPLVSSNDYSIYDEMRDDDQIKVALTLKKDLILNTGWKINSDNDEVREAVTENLSSLGFNESLEASFEEVLRDIMSAFDYGFSLAEPLYRSPADSKSGKWELRTIKVRPPHSFIFHLEKDGTVREIEQLAQGNPKLKPESLIHHVYQPEFGNPYGKSDLRSAHTAWKAKKFLFRMSMRYAERFAGPTVIGRYPSNAGAGTASRLLAVLESMQDNTTLVIPDDAKIELIQAAKDSSELYERLLNWLNTSMSRSILVPDLMGTHGAQTSGGSYALGKEQFKVFLASIKNERVALEKKINLKIVKPLVRINYGDVDCRFEFLPLEPDNEGDLLKIWLEAVNGRVFKASEEEVNHLRRKTGFPEGPVELIDQAAEERARLEAAAALKDAAGESEKEDEEQPVPPKKMARYRELLPSEAKMDFSAMAQVLDSSETGIHREVSKLLVRMSNDLLDQARSKGILEKFKPEKMASLELHYRRELNDLLRGHFVGLFRSGVDFAKKEIFKDPAKRMSADDLLPDDFESLIRAESFKLTGDLSENIRRRFSDKTFEGLKSGSPMSKVAEDIAESVRKYTENQVLTVLRTKTTEVFNAARKTFFDSDPFVSQILVGYQYSAVMDENTTSVCQKLDGKVFSREEAEFLAKATPPLHWGCRSTLVPITRFEPEAKRMDRPVDIEKLKSWGANLLSSRAAFRPYAQLKRITIAFDKAGDHPILPSKNGVRYFISNLRASNLDTEYPVTVHFKQGGDGGSLYTTVLPKTGGTFDKSFGHDGWGMDEGAPLYANLSASIKVEFSVEYWEREKDVIGDDLPVLPEGS